MNSNSQTNPKGSGTAVVAEAGHAVQASTDGQTKRGQALVDGKESPPRVLTKNTATKNVGDHDNVDSDLILRTQDILESSSKRRYKIIEFLGSGTFGQVVKCKILPRKTIATYVSTPETDDASVAQGHSQHVAVKIVKSKDAYFRQALTEIRILKFVKESIGVSEDGPLVEMYDYFKFKGHLCIVFEMLGENLYELLRSNQFRGLPTRSVRIYLEQILRGCKALNDAKIIHCDLKPENILIVGPKEDLRIKIIDLGSACFEGQTVYSYIQSRFYRAPEVLLRLGYDSAIDIWSIGCIAAEIFLGLPLFPGVSEHSQLSRIIDMFETYPPDHMLRRGRGTKKYFKPRKSSITTPPSPNPTDNQSPMFSGQHKRKLLSSKARYSMKPAPADTLLQFKTPEEYAKDLNRDVDEYKTYFRYARLHDVIMYYPMSQVDASKERLDRLSFIDLLNGLLNMDHCERWTAEQAMQHPFVKGEKLPSDGYKPPSDQKLERRRQDMCAELKKLRLVDDKTARIGKNSNNSVGKHIRGTSDASSHGYTRPVKIRRNSRRGSLESTLSKQSNNESNAEINYGKPIQRDETAVPILPATDLTPPQQTSQLSLRGKKYRKASDGETLSSPNHSKTKAVGNDDFASQAKTSSGFLGTSLPSSQSYMKALGTGNISKIATNLSTPGINTSNFGNKKFALSSSYPYTFQMSERPNFVTQPQHQHAQQNLDDSQVHVGVGQVRITDYDVEGGIVASEQNVHNTKRSPQRMRRAQLAVGELHQPVQNSGRPFQFLPYQNGVTGGFNQSNNQAGQISGAGKDFFGAIKNNNAGGIFGESNKAGGTGLSSSYGGWTGNFTGAQSWGGVTGSGFIQPPTFRHGHQNGFDSMDNTSGGNNMAESQMVFDNNSNSGNDGALPIKKRQSLLSGMLKFNDSEGMEITNTGSENNHDADSPSFSNGMFNFYGHVGSAPATSGQYLFKASSSSGNNGSAFGTNNNINFGDSQPISPNLSPRGPFLGETSPLYEEDDDQFDLEMDMGTQGDNHEAGVLGNNRSPSDSLGTAIGIPIPKKKSSDET